MATPTVHLLGAISAGSTSEKIDLWLPHRPAEPLPPVLASYPVDTTLTRLKVRVWGLKVTLTLRFVGTVSVCLAGGGP